MLWDHKQRRSGWGMVLYGFLERTMFRKVAWKKSSVGQVHVSVLGLFNFHVRWFDSCTCICLIDISTCNDKISFANVKSFGHCQISNLEEIFLIALHNSTDMAAESNGFTLVMLVGWSIKWQCFLMKT